MQLAPESAVTVSVTKSKGTGPALLCQLKAKWQLAAPKQIAPYALAAEVQIAFNPDFKHANNMKSSL